MKKILLANPRGFCAGVDRAITIVEKSLEKFGAPVYVRHEVVHNKYVVDGLKERGAIFIESLDAVPAGATLVFSAHGVPKSVEREAQRVGMRLAAAFGHRFGKIGEQAGEPEPETDLEIEPRALAWHE